MVFNLLRRQNQQTGGKTLNCVVLCLILMHVFPGHTLLLGEHKYERIIKDNKEDRNNRSHNKEPITFKHDLWIPDRNGWRNRLQFQIQVTMNLFGKTLNRISIR